MPYTVDAFNPNSPLDSDSPASNVAAELRAIKARLAAMQHAINVGSVPIGTIIAFPASSVTSIPSYIQLPEAPWVLVRSEWTALFAVIGTHWGTGDGVTTFGLPYVEAGSALIKASGSGVTNGGIINHTHEYYDGYFCEQDAGGVAIDRKTSIPPSTYTGSGRSDEDNNTIYERLMVTQNPNGGSTKNLSAGTNVIFYLKAI